MDSCLGFVPNCYRAVFYMARQDLQEQNEQWVENILVDTTADRAQIRWDKVEDIYSIKYWFQDLESAGVMAPAGSAMIVGGLDPSTSYVFQFCMCNASGEGERSQVISFTTKELSLDTPVIQSKQATDTAATIFFYGIRGRRPV